jgi:hypothetical protein
MLKLLFTSSATLLSATLAAAETLTMPRELVEYAQEQGCQPIGDFFERPGPINPPYAYFAPVLVADEEGAALWCQKSGAGRAQYVLLIKGSSERLFGTCPARIDYWNYPGGLSLESRRDLRLNEFRLASAPDKPGPDVSVSQEVIVSSYDGVEAIFACYRGDWLYRMLH